MLALRPMPPASADDLLRIGLADAQDRCPDTPASLPVDAEGRALFDWVASPDLALGPEAARLRQLQTDLSRWSYLADAVNSLVVTDTHPALVLLHQRDLPGALQSQ